MREAMLAFAVVVLAACAGPDEGPPAELQDPHCRSIAADRARDAAENGYDEDMQRRIFEDSYRRCLTSTAHFTR